MSTKIRNATTVALLICAVFQVFCADESDDKPFVVTPDAPFWKRIGDEGYAEARDEFYGQEAEAAAVFMDAWVAQKGWLGKLPLRTPPSPKRTTWVLLRLTKEKTLHCRMADFSQNKRLAKLKPSDEVTILGELREFHRVKLGIDKCRLP